MEKLKGRWLQILAHVGALIPLALLIWGYTQNQLTANPIREITLRTGRVALVLLLLSLACTPVYILLTFVGLDYGFDFALIVPEVLQKRFVQVGMLAFLLLLPLAITSTRGWIKRLGKNWKRLHRLVYLAAVAVVIHFVWVAKGDIRRPLRYGAVLVLLLLIRVPPIRRVLRRRQADGSP